MGRSYIYIYTVYIYHNNQPKGSKGGKYTNIPWIMDPMGFGESTRNCIKLTDAALSILRHGFPVCVAVLFGPGTGTDDVFL